MLSTHGFSLTSRVVLINGLLFALGTAALALSPATVSQQPLLSEIVVLVVGLSVMHPRQHVLVGASLRPLDRLVGRWTGRGRRSPIERVPVPATGIARQLATAVNDLLGRVESGQRASNIAALAAQEAERAPDRPGAARPASARSSPRSCSRSAVLAETPTELRRPWSGLREGTRASLDEVREVARELRPHVLEDLGLRSALGRTRPRTCSRTATLTYGDGIMPGLPVLDDATELVVFRVAQEALTNVARHAHAEDRRAARSARAATTSCCRVGDDGVGIGRHADGTGLRGMRERALLVGGELDVRRRAGAAPRSTSPCRWRSHDPRLGSCSPTTTRWCGAGSG